MKRIEVVKGALVRIEGKGNRNVGAFLAWALDNNVSGYSVGWTSADAHVGFYDTAALEKIEAWARATGCVVVVKP